MLLDDIHTYLGGFTFTSGSTTFTLRKYAQPDAPDATVTVLEFASGANYRAMGASLRNPVKERCGLQVLVRGPMDDYAAARDAAEQVHLKLDFLVATLSGRSYYVEAMHNPVLLEQDRSKRWLLSTNYVVLKDRG